MAKLRKVVEVVEVAEQFLSKEVSFAYFDATLNELDVEDARELARIIVKGDRAK